MVITLEVLYALMLFCSLRFFTELAAAIPRAEVVGKSDYFRFGMRDSLAIEASFLQVSFSNFKVTK